MEKVTVFRNFIKVIGYRSVGEIVKGIQQGVYMDEIGAIRRAVDRGDKKLADGLKKQLLAVTFSGCFQGGRSLQALKVYYPLIVLDVDGLKDFGEAERIRDLAFEVAYTMVAFVSPSGRGCKIVVRTDSSEGMHGVAFQLVSAFYESKLRITIDGSGKDITRLCFMSFDESVKYRVDSKVFSINHGKTKSIFESSTKVLNDGGQTTDGGQLTSVEIQSAVGSVQSSVGLGKTGILNGDSYGEDGQTAEGGRLTSADLEQENFRTRNYMQRAPLNPLKGKPPATGTEQESQLIEVLEFTKQKMEYVEGNRNNFVYLFACNCNREGIGEEEVYAFAKQEFDLPKGEIRQAVRSAYGHHVDEFGVRKRERMMVGKMTVEELYERMMETPCMEDGIFELLPKVLRDSCGHFEDRRSRDVFFVGALAVLSGCLEKVLGGYNGMPQYPNLFAFIVAPAGAGKGVLYFSKLLGMGLHRRARKESEEAKKVYEMEMIDYQMLMAEYKRKKRAAMPEKPLEPKRQLLFIPANSSSAKVIQHLEEAGGSGIMCETEADTLGNVLKQDWGGFSDLLRKAFHFEPISYSRKGNDELLEIEDARLSVAISGTPDQILDLIPSAEDGLFSRFVFYVFNSEVKWKDVSMHWDEPNQQEVFSGYSEEVLKIVDWLMQYPTRVQVTLEQWEELNGFFDGLLKKAAALEGVQTIGTVKRLGSILVRIISVLSALRKYDEQKVEELWYCQQVDFEVAFSIVKTLWAHSVFLFELLPKKSRIHLERMPNRKKAFYEGLPERFLRKEALVIGNQLGIADRTVTKYLKGFVEKGFLSQPKYGAYEKQK